MLFFCVFAYWDIDYFGLYGDFLIMNRGGAHRDVIYPWLVKISFGSYTLFRFYIWGIAELLFYKAVKLLGLDRNLTIYVMIMNFMLLFSYARASLGMSFYFYGITCFAMSKSKGKGVLVMLLCFLFSYFSHRSMLILIALTPLFFVKLNTRRLILFGIVFFAALIPLSRYILLSSASGDALVGGDEFSEFNAAAQQYANYDESYLREDNWKFTLIKRLRNLSVIVGVVLSAFIILRKKNKIFVDAYMNRLLMLSIGIVLVAITFLIQTSSYGSEIIGYRILYMAGIPVVLMLSYLYENGLCSWKTLHWAFLPSILFQEGFIIGKIISLGIF